MYIVYLNISDTELLLATVPELRGPCSDQRTKRNLKYHKPSTKLKVYLLEIPASGTQIIVNHDLMLILITVKRKTFDGENEFFQDRVSTATGSAFIFLSLALLSQLRTTTEIRGDGTFKNTPILFYCLLYTSCTKER